MAGSPTHLSRRTSCPFLGPEWLRDRVKPHCDEPRERLGRRVGKLLPLFLLSGVLDLPIAAITQYLAGCILFWPASALQPFLLSPLTGLSPHIRRLKVVSWYLGCLLGLCIAFAFLKVDLLDRHLRAAVGCAVLASLLCSRAVDSDRDQQARAPGTASPRVLY